MSRRRLRCEAHLLLLGSVAAVEFGRGGSPVGVQAVETGRALCAIATGEGADGGKGLTDFDVVDVGGTGRDAEDVVDGV